MARTAPVSWRDEEEHRRLIAGVVNGAIDGRTNNAGSVTLSASTSSTVVADARAGVDSVVLFMPKTANAAAAQSSMYVSSRDKQTFTITHANNAQSDREFDYALIATGRGT